MDNRDKLVDLLLFANEIAAISGRELDTDEVNDFADFLDINDVVVQKWVSVEERLPEIDEEVLVCTNERLYAVAQYAGAERFWTLERNPSAWVTATGVTHWMPLPEPPKEVQHE